MRPARTALLLALAAAPGTAVATDMLPLKQGIYVPANRPCKGASNAEILNYWGKDNSLGVAQASCKIRKLSHQGTRYTITERCTDRQSGSEIAGDPTIVTISSPTSFTTSGTAYRYCGRKVQF